MNSKLDEVSKSGSNVLQKLEVLLSGQSNAMADGFGKIKKQEQLLSEKIEEMETVESKK